MCGIAGHAGPAGPAGGDARAALARLRHRGPDSEDARIWDGEAVSWTLLHTRLAILDLSPAGNEPMDNEDGSLVLTYNGEIYNYPELRATCEARGHRFRSDCDGEVILHLWEDHGAEALRMLNGIFAFAVASTVSGDVWLARDPLGVKPLFYATNGPALWFASEIEALRAYGAPLGGDDTVALAQLLTFLWIPGPRTPFANVRSLEPGCVLHWRNGQQSNARIVDLIAEARGGETSMPDQVREHVFAAVRRQLQADVPVSIMASGGIDSSLIWWAAGDALARAYTIDSRGEPGFEGLHEDAATVELLSRTLGTEVVRIEDAGVADLAELPRSGDLFADPAFHLTRAIARSASERGEKVLLSGQGADEVFGGYRRHQAAAAIDRIRLGRAGAALSRGLRHVPVESTAIEYVARLGRAMAQRDPRRAYLELCSYSAAADRASVLGVYESEVADDVVWQVHLDAFERMPPHWSLSRQARGVDLVVYLPGLGLAYVDRAGMEYGVEIRVPMLDLELVRWGLRLREDDLVRGRATKVVLRALARDVLPARVATRPKRGFAVGTERIRRAVGRSGERGFRQSVYFSLASKMLHRHLQRAGA